MNKKCIICGRDDQPWFSKKRCRTCAQRSYKQPQRTPLKRTYIKKERNKELDDYFIFHITKCKKSEESRQSISATKANICHLFDKSRHPSLRADFRNFLYLTIEEHSQFDNLLYTHQFERLEKEFPNSWPIACRRMKKLLDLCLEETKFKYKIKEYLDEKL